MTVNRIWQAYFGKGLVETENDFGTQGTPPSHPELLDWLATELIARDWSQKEFHKLIITSRTYKQSSVVRPDLAKADPYNKWLARQSRLRLDAELIRDATLAVSGLLATHVGGPSVFPPQPDGVMGLGQVKRQWVVSKGADRYRRGLYTYFWRSSPHPSLTVLDAPNSVLACTRRIRSNTPVQALTLLNDEVSFECAGALAQRILAEAPSNDPSRIEHASRLCLSRGPTERERWTLERVLAEERADAGSSEKAADLAAWTTAARVLLNLDEFITRNDRPLPVSAECSLFHTSDDECVKCSLAAIAWKWERDNVAVRGPLLTESDDSHVTTLSDVRLRLRTGGARLQGPRLGVAARIDPPSAAPDHGRREPGRSMHCGTHYMEL